MESNGSNVSAEHEAQQQHNAESRNLIIFGVKCSIITWIVFINLLFMCSMCRNGRLRKRQSFWLLLNLALADLLVGALVTPLSVFYFRYYELDTLWCYTWIFSDVLLNSASLLALLSINIDRLVFVIKPLTYSMVMRKPFCVCLVLFSWLLAAGFAVPLIYAEQIISRDGNCFLNMARLYAIGSVIGSFFLPALLVIITNIFIVRIVSRKTKSKRYYGSRSVPFNENSPDTMEPTLIVGHQQNVAAMATMVESREKATRDSNERLRKAAGVVSVANAVYLLMWLPFYLLNTLQAFDAYPPDWPFYVLEMALWFGYANSGVNPLIWMLLPDVRETFRGCCCGCCCCEGGKKSDHHDKKKDTDKMYITDHSL